MNTVGDLVKALGDFDQTLPIRMAKGGADCGGYYEHFICDVFDLSVKEVEEWEQCSSTPKLVKIKAVVIE